MPKTLCKVAVGIGSIAANSPPALAASKAVLAQASDPMTGATVDRWRASEWRGN